MALGDKPIVKATIQTAGLSAVSNVLAQLIAQDRANVEYSIDLIPIFQFVIFAVVSTPPNFLWQEFLEKTFPSHPASVHPKKSDDPQPPPKLSLRNTFIKFFLDQSIGAVLNTLLFSTFMTSLQVAMSPAPRITDIRKAVNYWTSPGVIDFSQVDTAQVWDKALGELWPIMFAGWRLWPIVSLVNFTLIKSVEGRNLVGALAGVIWGVYMSMLAAH